VLLACISATIASAQDSEFTSSERRALVAGDLVRRNLSQHNLYGGTSWQLVRAPIDRVWQVAIDPSSYPHLIPSLEEARVVEEHGSHRIVYMRHAYGVFSSVYYARMHIDEHARTVRFELDDTRPHDMRAGRGFMTLSPYHGGTIVTWGMLADPGAGIVMQAFAPFLNEWLLLPPRCMRDEVEPGRVSSC